MKIQNKQFGKMLLSHKGFTLVELLVTFVILIIVIGLAFNFFTASGNFFNKNSIQADAQAQSRLLFQGLKIEISGASSVLVAYSNNPEEIKTFLPEGVGAFAFFVDGNMLCKMDENGVIQKAFGSMPVEYLEVVYVPDIGNGDNPKIIKVIIDIDYSYHYETEILSPNTSIEIIPETSESGNVLILTQAT